MYALVVVESMFGNTRDVGRAVARGLAERAEVDVVDVADAPGRLPPGTDLLVVGAPTHAFGLSRPGTRADARRQAGDTGPSVRVETGLREWLAALEAPAPGACAAAFDTRVAHPRLPGSAAHAAHRRLRGLGFTAVAAPESFWVDGTKGPLDAGEPERAAAWGAELVRAVQDPGHGRGRIGA